MAEQPHTAPRAVQSLLYACEQVTDRVAAVVRWSLLIDVMLIAGHAFSRKFFGIAHNFVLDLQWHFFAIVVLLMAGYTLKRNEHVRIDIFSHRLGDRGMAWLDLAGFAFFLLPLCLAMVWFSWPVFVMAFKAGEFSREVVGGVPRWVMKGLIPIGFSLLAIQAVAEIIKCIGCLKGWWPRPVVRNKLVEGA